MWLTNISSLTTLLLFMFVYIRSRASLVAQSVKNLPEVQETQVQSLGQKNPLKKEVENHSSILAWKIPWTEEHGRLQSMGSQRVRHYWATITYLKRKRVGRDSKQERLQLWKYMLRCWHVDWKNADYLNRRSTWAYARKVASARLLSVSNVQQRRGECVV